MTYGCHCGRALPDTLYYRKEEKSRLACTHPGAGRDARCSHFLLQFCFMGLIGNVVASLLEA